MIDRGIDFAAELENASATAPLTRLGLGESACDLPIQGIGISLADIEKQLKNATRSRFPEVDRLSAPAASMGGKRLRPMLVLLSAAACRRERLSPRQEMDLQSIAVAVELVHAASLVHDDVMDCAAERRHQPTVGAIEGNSAAVLLGDFLFTRAYAVAANCRNSFPARQIAKASTALCEGELRQQASAGNWAISLREYRSVLEQKTGALCEVSCRLGVWGAGGPMKHGKALAKFGRSLGLAFQIFDDWLDYWGTDAVGKTLGTDLDQRKPTLPLIRLLSVSSPTARKHVLNLLESDEKDVAERIRFQLDRCDAREFTLAYARKCTQQAIDALSVLPPSASRSFLCEVAKFSVARAA